MGGVDGSFGEQSDETPASPPSATASATSWVTRRAVKPCARQIRSIIACMSMRVPRPRRRGDPELAALEGRILDHLLDGRG
jgi:hypothetical protein